MHRFKWTYFHGCTVPYLQRCCQGHGATNAASRMGPAFPSCWQRLCYAALLGEWHHEESRRFHARLWDALLWAGRCCIVSSSSVFSKNVEASNSWSFDIEKCITDMSNCQPFGNPGDLTEINKGKKILCVGGIVWEILWKPFFLFINSNCNSARVRTSSVTSTD